MTPIFPAWMPAELRREWRWYVHNNYRARIAYRAARERGYRREAAMHARDAAEA